MYVWVKKSDDPLGCRKVILSSVMFSFAVRMQATHYESSYTAVMYSEFTFGALQDLFKNALSQTMHISSFHILMSFENCLTATSTSDLGM